MAFKHSQRRECSLLMELLKEEMKPVHIDLSNTNKSIEIEDEFKRSLSANIDVRETKKHIDIKKKN